MAKKAVYLYSAFSALAFLEVAASGRREHRAEAQDANAAARSVLNSDVDYVVANAGSAARRNGGGGGARRRHQGRDASVAGMNLEAAAAADVTEGSHLHDLLIPADSFTSVAAVSELMESAMEAASEAEEADNEQAYEWVHGDDRDTRAGGYDDTNADEPIYERTSNEVSERARALFPNPIKLIKKSRLKTIHQNFVAQLNGLNEDPSVLTPARGTLGLRFELFEPTATYSLSYTGFSSNVRIAQIFVGQSRTTGEGGVVQLCNNVLDGSSAPACPGGAGTVVGTISSTNIDNGATGQGLPANNFTAFQIAVLSQATYVNIFTQDFRENNSPGEIRGQLLPY